MDEDVKQLYKELIKSNVVIADKLDRIVAQQAEAKECLKQIAAALNRRNLG